MGFTFLTIQKAWQHINSEIDERGYPAGRGPGQKWRSKQVRVSSKIWLEFDYFLTFFSSIILEKEATSYCSSAKLSRHRTNHNLGIRVISLKCPHLHCPVRLRLCKNYQPLEVAHPYDIQRVEGTQHNHCSVIPYVHLWILRYTP